MSKKGTIKMFSNGKQTAPLKTKYETNRILNNHIDEICSVDLMDMSDYKVSNKKISDTFSIQSAISQNIQYV